jgi:hypothetical protein
MWKRTYKPALLPTAALVIVIVSLACGAEQAAGPEVPTAIAAPEVPTAISEDARSYLNAALDTMQLHSINRYRIDWPHVRNWTFHRAGAAQTFRDTYDAIRFALGELGDNHSFFWVPDSFPIRAPPEAPVNPPPQGERREDSVGYLMIPWFSIFAIDADPVRFADQVQAIIQQVDTTGLCGWVVDLRGNGGGSMWPMLAGVGPVLGEGTVGYFVDPDSNWTPWYYRDGESGLHDTLGMTQVSGQPYELLYAMPTVVVLTGPGTASSGEAIVTAFRARPNTRSFGLSTHGLSTANRDFRLIDGALLILTVSAFADRARQVYGGVMEPDSVVGGWNTYYPLATDNVVQLATDWLKANGDCT